MQGTAHHAHFGHFKWRVACQRQVNNRIATFICESTQGYVRSEAIAGALACISSQTVRESALQFHERRR